MSVNVLEEDGLKKIAGNGGYSKEIEKKLQELEKLTEQTRQLRADLETYGLVKLSSESGMADPTGLALPVTEKNPDIEGTMANKILSIERNNNLETIRLDKIGWYRIAKYGPSNGVEYKGYAGNGCGILLKRTYGNNSNEFHNIQFCSVHNKSKFKYITGLAIGNIITKIRHTIDSNSNTAYLEIFYNSSVGNSLCTVLQGGMDAFTNWQAISIYPTEESIEGVTILSELNIAEELSKLQ